MVNISSAIGRMSDRGFAAYGTAKGALTHLTRLLAADLAPRVRVNGIAVGSVATSALQVVLDSEEIHDEMVRRTPLQRLGDPRTSPPPPSGSPPPPASGSPARSWRSTAASSPPTWPWACRTSNDNDARRGRGGRPPSPRALRPDSANCVPSRQPSGTNDARTLDRRRQA